MITAHKVLHVVHLWNPANEGDFPKDGIVPSSWYRWCKFNFDMKITWERITFALLLASGCSSGEIIGTGYIDDGEIPTFSEFESATYHETSEDGVYIVNGDTPVANEKQLREYYDSIFTSALIVNKRGNADNRWSDSQKLNLTYCISNDFGNRKQAVIAAMDGATQNGWEAAADVDFIYVPSQDGNCTANNSNVLFDIRPTPARAPYLARAFFPGQPRQSRNIILDSSAFFAGWSLQSILAHELGHTLGFRHEHTRPEAGACYEDNRWRPLSAYDAASIMHYPQCNGASNALSFSQTDFAGAASLYGQPGAGNGGETPQPSPGTPQSGQVSDSVAKDSRVEFQPLSVVSGSSLRVAMTGNGDADLYVRFGSLPTLTEFDCRPYTNGSTETCTLDVPSTASEAYIMVHGYAASDFSLDAEWVAP